MLSKKIKMEVSYFLRYKTNGKKNLINRSYFSYIGVLIVPKPYPIDLPHWKTKMLYKHIDCFLELAK